MDEPAPSADAGIPVATAPLKSSVPRVHLHRHALESIFGFLALADLAMVSRVSKDWSARTLSMAPLRASFFVRTSAHSLFVSQPPDQHASRFAVHLDSFVDSTTRPWTVARLSLLSAAASNLTRLSLELEELSAGPIAFPAKLRSLQITLRTLPDEVNRTLGAIGSLPQLESLDATICTDPDLGHVVDLTALRECPVLRSLRVEAAWGGSNWTDQQHDQLRAMPHLTSLCIAPLFLPMLSSLLRSPCPRWEELDAGSQLPMAEAVNELLSTLPLKRLGTVAAPRHLLRSVAFLHTLSGTLAQLHLDGTFNQVDGSDLEGALARCVHLHELGLSHVAGLSSAQLTVVLRATFLLKRLLLRKLRVDSLSFLSSVGVPLLEDLTLAHLRLLASEQLQYLRPQSGLRTLRLEQPFNDHVPEESLALLRPPSAWFPMLESFEFQQSPSQRW